MDMLGTPLTIRIQTYEEGLKKQNGLAFSPEKPIIEAKFKEACIMERGTVEGKSSIGFFLIDANGNQIFAQLTGNLVQGLNSALQGAKGRWGEI